MRALCFALALVASARAAEIAAKPVRVCNALKDTAAYNGKTVAVIGRYSFRDKGRFLAEESCGGRDLPNSIRIAFDAKSAPRPSEHFEVDGRSTTEQLKLIEQHTQLAKFPFGTPDYDRWAVVYGRLEADKDGPRLICVSEAVVMFILGK